MNCSFIDYIFQNKSEDFSYMVFLEYFQSICVFSQNMSVLILCVWKRGVVKCGLKNNKNVIIKIAVGCIKIFRKKKKC